MNLERASDAEAGRCPALPDQLTLLSSTSSTQLAALALKGRLASRFAPPPPPSPSPSPPPPPPPPLPHPSAPVSPTPSPRERSLRTSLCVALWLAGASASPACTALPLPLPRGVGAVASQLPQAVVESPAPVTGVVDEETGRARGVDGLPRPRDDVKGEIGFSSIMLVGLTLSSVFVGRECTGSCGVVLGARGEEGAVRGVVGMKEFARGRKVPGDSGCRRCISNLSFSCSCVC